MKTSFSQLLFGLIIIGLGIGFLLDNLNLIDFGTIIGVWWPLFVILLGVVSFVGNPRSLVFPLSAIVVGTLLQLRELDILSFDLGSLIWPAIFIFAGLNIIFGRLGSSKGTKDESSSLLAFLSGIETKNKSAQYSGGKLTAILGGITLDLRDATIKDSADLDVFTLMGGVELQVPEGWQVHTSGTPILGGWEDKTAKPVGKNTPILRVHSTCIMGGIEIKN